MRALSSLLAAGPLQVPADTVATVVVRDAFDWVLVLAGGVFGLVFLVLLAGLLFFFFQLHAAVRSIRQTRDQILSDPAVVHLRKAAENLESITSVVREEVSELSDAVGALSARLTQASDHLDTRISDFNALMEVVQEEAESTFVRTASTARGLRSGVRALRRKGAHVPPPDIEHSREEAP
jgi:hypothetical protein